jgi:hypothetical protein
MQLPLSGEKLRAGGFRFPGNRLAAGNGLDLAAVEAGAQDPAGSTRRILDRRGLVCNYRV